MKKSILITIILLSIFELNAQIDRINHYVAGTKVSLFPDQCGEELPEAEGKLTYCRGGDLGVVDNSLGLNARSVQRMVPNHYNNDLVFITTEGISIEKEDGTWDNVPNRAMPDWSSSAGISALIRDAVVLPNGNMVILGSNFGQDLVIYSMNDKTISTVSITDGSGIYPSAICYDPDRDVCWVLTFQSNNSFLYKYENDVLTFEYELTDAPLTSVYQSDLWQYNNNRLFKASNTGLTVIDIDGETFSEVKHDQTNSGTLLYDICYDMEIDNEGFVWLLQVAVGNNDATVIKFDAEEISYQSFQFEHPTSEGIIITFTTIGQDRNTGLIWLVGNNLSGLVNLQIVDDEPVWNYLPNEDFDALGVPYIYNANFIHTQGEQTFFCTNSNSTSSNQENEILVLEGDIWTGINDDEEGNISSRMVRRFQGSCNNNSGGIWWLNPSDDDLVYMVDDDNFLHFPEYDPISDFAAVVAQNQNLVLRSEEGFGEFSATGLIPYEESSIVALGYNPEYVSAWSNEIWSRSGQTSSLQYLLRYINGEIVQEFETTELNGYNKFTMTTDKKAVFTKTISGTVSAKIFDPVTEEISEINYPGTIGEIRDVLPAEDGNFWIIGWYGMLYYNGSEFEYYDDENLDLVFVFSNNSITNAVLDQDQKLHFLLAGGYIYTIAPPYNNFEIETFNQINGPDGLMPFYQTSDVSFTELTLDSEGDMWLARFGSIIELQRENGVPEFDVSDIVGVEELYHNNIDFEMFPNPNSSGQIKIILPEGFGQSTLSILDMQGKLVGQYIIKRTNETIELKNITSGFYMVNISNEEYTMSKKLIIE